MASLVTSDPQRVSAADLADRFGISKGTVLRLANQGTIPGYRIGRQWRFDIPEVDKALRGAA